MLHPPSWTPTPSKPQHRPIKVFQARNLFLVVFPNKITPLCINQPRLFRRGSHGEVDLFGNNTGSFQINTNCSPKLLNSLNCSPLFGNHLRQFNKKLSVERQLQIDKVFETLLISLLSGKFIHLKQNEEDKHPHSVRKTPPATELLKFLFQRCSYYLERTATRLKQGSPLRRWRINSTRLFMAEKKQDLKKNNNNDNKNNNTANAWAGCGGDRGWCCPRGGSGMQELAGRHRAPAGLKLSPRRGRENLFHFGLFPISQPLRGQEVQCGWWGGKGRPGQGWAGGKGRCVVGCSASLHCGEKGGCWRHNPGKEL